MMTLSRLEKLIEEVLKMDRSVAMSRLDLWDYYAPYYMLMYYLVKELDPCVAVELGVDKGRACKSMLFAASSSSRVIGVDSRRDLGITVLQELFPIFTFVEAASCPVPEEIPENIDILHIDTLHTYTQAKAEFEAYESRLKNGAVVLFDDVHAADDGVLKYFQELLHPKIQEDRLHPKNSRNPCGYGVMIVTR